MRSSVVLAVLVCGVLLAALIPQLSVSAAHIRHVSRSHRTRDHTAHQQTAAERRHFEALDAMTYLLSQAVERSSVSVGDPKPGRYVVLAGRDGSVCLNIAEVKVIADGNNVAQGKTVTQSSFWNKLQMPGANLVDGDTGNFAHTSCNGVSGRRDAQQALTQFGPQYPDAGGEWMMIDLGGDFNIATVEVWNRADCCQDRIGGVIVYIFNNANTLQFTAPLVAQPTNTLTVQL